MIYLNSSVALASVALAQLFGEGRSPPDALWQEPLVSSRLLEYEIWNRVHVRGFEPGARRSCASADRAFETDRTHTAGLGSGIAALSRPGAHPRLPSPRDNRIYPRARRGELASYDNRLLTAARALGIALSPL